MPDVLFIYKFEKVKTKAVLINALDDLRGRILINNELYIHFRHPAISFYEIFNLVYNKFKSSGSLKSTDIIHALINENGHSFSTLRLKKKGNKTMQRLTFQHLEIK